MTSNVDKREADRSMTAEKLRDEIDAGEDISIVDVRFEDEFEDWRIPGSENIPFMDIEEEPDEYADEIPEDKPVYMVCAKGGSSGYAADMMDERGHDNVYNVEGGMEAWSAVYDVVDLDIGDDDVDVKQVQRRAKGCLSYVVGDKESGTAAVIDATQHTEEFKDIAEENGYEITHVLDTHIHADHLSGGEDLAHEVDATYYLPEGAPERGAEGDFETLGDGEVLEVGDSLEIEGVHAPGHTTDIMNYLINGEALATGDTIFVESIGRPDLEGGDEGAEDFAHRQYETIHERILSLDNDTVILPGHFSVGADGEAIGVEFAEPMVTTVGELKEENPVLQMDEDDFVESLLSDMPSRPSNYTDIIETNLGQNEIEDEEEAINLELGPNNCAASQDDMTADAD
ncbi:MAG: rhodanese-like domain-containing protein [Halobacteria archaeon]|nr:rhodanese-like domain-containing protein [Halobacteria archaeon]